MLKLLQGAECQLLRCGAATYCNHAQPLLTTAKGEMQRDSQRGRSDLRKLGHFDGPSRAEHDEGLKLGISPGRLNASLQAAREAVEAVAV